jgi:hypothetical protein
MATRELLKREAYGGVGSDDAPVARDPSDTSFQRNRPGWRAVTGTVDHYLVLDSFNKSARSDPANGIYSWDIMVEGAAGDGHAGLRYRPETIVEIEIMPFSMPIIEDVPYIYFTRTPALGLNPLNYPNLQNVSGPPTLIQDSLAGYGQYPISLLAQELFVSKLAKRPWINNPLSQVPCGNKLTIQIVEAGKQAYSDHGAYGGPAPFIHGNLWALDDIVVPPSATAPLQPPFTPSTRGNVRHHFEMSLGYFSLLGATNPNFVQAIPLTNCNRYTFTDPLKSLETITLAFRNPDIPLSFLPDVYRNVPLVLQTAAGGPWLRFDLANHLLFGGDRVYITGCATGHPNIDAHINRVEGHAVNSNPAVSPKTFPGIPLKTPDSFWTDPAVSLADFTPAPTPLFPQSVNVYVLRRRLRIQLHLRGATPRLTSYHYF